MTIKKFSGFFGLLLVVCLWTPSFADPLLYLDFDDSAPKSLSAGEIYYPTYWYERATSVTAIYAEALGSGADTVDIKVPDGDGTNYPATVGPEGGQAMVIGSGGYEEGFNIEMSSAYHINDYTVEVSFWLSTNDLAGNTINGTPYDIQNIWDETWPWFDPFTSSLRVIGRADLVGRAADNQTLELAFWEGDGTEVRINTSTPIAQQVWHTAQMTFDYNDVDPSACTVQLFLDGSMVGSANFDGTLTSSPPEAGGRTISYTNGWGVYGTPATESLRNGFGSWRFFLGCSSSRQINFTDIRGMKGAIDAFCISEGVLTPAEFVLPAGFDPGPPPVVLRAESTWTLYE